MRSRPTLLLIAVFGAACLFIGPAMSVEPVGKSGRPPREPAPPATLTGRIAAASKVSEDDVKKVLQALGPVMKDDLQKGGTVSVTGLGSFRIVQLPEHRDLKDGKPVIIAPRNVVEFQPGGNLADAANAPGVEPAVVVPAFEYNALPGQTPGFKAGRTRAGDVRVP
jgi:nucleoid DNA-binding protein